MFAVAGGIIIAILFFAFLPIILRVGFSLMSIAICALLLLAAAAIVSELGQELWHNPEIIIVAAVFGLCASPVLWLGMRDKTKPLNSISRNIFWGLGALLVIIAASVLLLPMMYYFTNNIYEALVICGIVVGGSTWISTKISKKTERNLNS